MLPEDQNIFNKNPEDQVLKLAKSLENTSTCIGEFNKEINEIKLTNEEFINEKNKNDTNY